MQSCRAHGQGNCGAFCEGQSFSRAVPSNRSSPPHPVVHSCEAIQSVSTSGASPKRQQRTEAATPHLARIPPDCVAVSVDWQTV